MKLGYLTHRGLPTLLVAACIAGVLYFALVFVPRERAAAVERSRRELEARADSRKTGVELWVERGLSEARGIAAFPSVLRLISGHAGSSKPKADAAEHVAEVLNRVTSAQGHVAGCVIDREGRIVAHATRQTGTEPACLEAARDVLQSGSIEIDFRGRQGGGSLVTFTVPLREAKTATPLGVVVVAEDPSEWLFPFVAMPAMDARSAESLLVRGEQRKAVFLTPLRHDPAPPLTLRRPLTLPHFAAREALEGREGFGAFRDYRDAPVFAATRVIRHTGWGLVTKVDQDEVLAPFRARMWRSGLTAGFLVVALATVAFLLWRAEHRASAAALAQSEERFRATFEQAAVGIGHAAPDGRWLRVNQRLCAILGRSPGELLQTTCENLIHPDDVDSHLGLLGRLLAAEAGSCSMDARCPRAGDSVVWIHLTASIVRADRGEPDYLIFVVEDITERKRAEDALRALSLRQQALLSAIPDVVMEVDAAKVYHWANPAGLEFFGADVVGKEAASYFAGEQGTYDAVRPLFEGDENVVYVESWQRRKDGERRLLAWWCRALKDSSGQVVGAISSARDITEARRAEEALRESERFTQSTLDSLSAHLAVLDEDGRILVVNQAWRDFAEANSAGARSVSEGADYLEVCGAAAGPGAATARDFASGIHQVIRGELTRFSLEYPCHSPDQQRWFVGHVTRFKGEGPTRVVVTHENVTERKLAEVASRESESRYRRLHESMRDAFVLVDMAGRILETNHAYQEMLGYAADELTRLTYTDLTPPDWHALETRIVADEILPAGHSGVYEKEYIRKDGTVFPVELRTFLLRDEAGAPAAMWAIVRDVSERKRLEAQLLQAQKMEAVGRLAGGVAHDFNNLLAVISGYTSLLTPELSAGSEPRAKLAEIEKATERAAGLARQLLAFSRQQASQPRALDLNAVIQGIEGMLRRLIGEDVALVTSCAPDLWLVRADRGQIEQVIMNLAVNARDAMPRGGKITISTANVDLRGQTPSPIHTAPSGPFVSLVVTDTGHGMDRKTLDHLFEPFFTTKGAGKGTGLGLATAYGILRQSGGHVEVDSEPGQGATFRVYLPRLEGALEVRSEAHPAAVVETELRGSETILLVEDEEALALVVSELLTASGYEVITATTPSEALRRADEHPGPIHILLTDVIMPQMNGRDLAAKVREQRSQIKVVFISGYADDVLGSVLAPDVAFVQKPFSQAALLEKLREVLRG